MFNQRQTDWCWSLITIVAFGIMIKYLSEPAGIALLIAYIFTSGYRIGIFDIQNIKKG